MLEHLSIGDLAPDFTLPNQEGELIQLSDIYKNHNVVLVFNIGFAWPHCTNHMAQLRHEYKKFSDLNAKILVMVPNGPFMIKRYLENNPTPYTILIDKKSQVAGRYFQNKQFFAFGTPTVFVVNREGKIAYTHYANSLIEEPGNEEPLAVLAQLAA